MLAKTGKNFKSDHKILLYAEGCFSKESRHFLACLIPRSTKLKLRAGMDDDK
jgi:hypothetical protein